MKRYKSYNEKSEELAKQIIKLIANSKQPLEETNKVSTKILKLVREAYIKGSNDLYQISKN